MSSCSTGMARLKTASTGFALPVGAVFNRALMRLSYSIQTQIRFKPIEEETLCQQSRLSLTRRRELR